MKKVRRQWALLALLSLGLSACGGSSGGGGTVVPPPPPPPPSGNVVISGVITFDRVPSIPGSGGGLDYANTTESPARAVTVEFVDGSTVVQSTVTDASGNYSLTVPVNRSGLIRVKAESVVAGGPSWDFRVVDNTSADALYAMDGAVFNTGTTDAVRNLNAASGWTGAAYTAARSAAPFAILDTVYDAAAPIVAADPTVSLPPLVLHWSENNRPSAGATGAPDIPNGDIVTSFFSPGLGGIFILGAADADTDEYDRHVISHEWGHYLETAVSRTDSVGGPHALGDRVDMRLAFSEGWGNAFSAIVTGDSVYRDVLGPGQSNAPGFDVEGPRVGPPFFENPNPTPGWYSEQSVQELLYDLVDTAADGADAVSLSFNAIYAVLVSELRTTPAMASIFPFINALRQRNPGEASLIDALIANVSMDTVVDDYGSTETNDAGTAFNDVLPIYSPILANGAAVNLCSTDEFRSNVSGSQNKLSSRRLLRFNLAAPADVTLTVTATSIPPGEIADPDLILHQAGATVLTSDASPTPTCASTLPQDCVEQANVQLGTGDYVLEIYEFSNAAGAAGPAPIGRTCFDVTVTHP